MTKSKGFMIYYDKRALWEALGTDQRSALILALIAYGDSGTKPQGLDAITSGIFEMMRLQIDQDTEKYDKIMTFKGKNEQTMKSEDVLPKSQLYLDSRGNFSTSRQDKTKQNKTIQEKKRQDNTTQDKIEERRSVNCGDGDVKWTDSDEERFNEFWRLYPKRKGKLEAQVAWSEAEIDENTASRICEAVIEAKRCEQWQTQNGRFIPNPARWIREKRWKDGTDEMRENYVPFADADDLDKPIDAEEERRKIIKLLGGDTDGTAQE